MKRILLYLCVAIVALSLAGCRSSQTAQGGFDKKTLGEVKERYEKNLTRNFDYEYLQAKMKYSLGGGKSLNGKLNIEHGKRLCMTVTVLGIEVARVEANQETVLVVDKVDKVYAKATIAEAAAQLGLENEAKLEAVEALLLGRIFVPGQGLATKADFSRLVWWPMENSELQADYMAEQYQLSYVLNATNQLVATQIKVPAKDASFVWEYANPLEINGGYIPGEETLSVAGPKSVSAQLAISSPSVSKKNWSSFSPSSSYKQVTFLELIEIIKKLKN